jgi:glycosyltransferase involved in cell wall biosynthesis
MLAALHRSLAGFDLAHLHSVFLWPTAATAAAARRLGIPYVISPRGMLVPELIRRKSWFLKRLWIELFERRNLAGAAAVHVTAEIEAADIWRLGLMVRGFATIPNGIEVPPAGTGTGAAPMDAISKPIVLFLGRVNWKKGLDRLIPAMLHVPDAQLVIAGNDEDGYALQMAALARRHGVAERTHFIGPLHGPAKWRAFAAADIFVLPSYSENFGNAVLEAMASGVPVIVTPEVGLARTVSETEAGLVVEGTHEKIGAAIAELLVNPNQRTRMGTAGRAAALKYFSWDGIAAQMEALYLSVKTVGASGTALPLNLKLQ